MEEIQNAKQLYTYISDDQNRAKILYKEKCSEMLVKMHQNGFCHGDFRSSNLLAVEGTEELYIIDFDWAGVAGDVRYPYFMKHIQIQWPQGAADGELIAMEHDTHFGNTMFV